MDYSIPVMIRFFKYPFFFWFVHIKKIKSHQNMIKNRSKAQHWEHTEIHINTINVTTW